MVLWQSLRDVWMWAGVPPEQRGDLFGPPPDADRDLSLRACGEAPELARALETFRVMREAAHVVEGHRVAEACRQVCRWAEAGSMIELAAYFAEGAAVADPENPARANEAARLCRRAALDKRAVVWYERAFQLAVRAGSRRESVWALLGYGSLLYGLGHYDRAKPIFEKVAKRAHRTGRRRTAAEAHHDLILLCLDLGNFSHAEEHARLAESLYPLQSRRIPYLVHDCAVLFIRENYHTSALSLLRKLPSHFTARPAEATLVWSTVARAAAGAAQVELYREAERRTLELAGMYDEHGAAALVSLAEGARSLGDDVQAKHFSDLAVGIAKRRRDGGQARRARDLSKRIERKEPVPREAPAPEEIGALARRLAARLRMWKGRDSQVPPDPPAEESPPTG